MSKMGQVVCEWDTLFLEVYASRLDWEEFKRRRIQQRNNGTARFDFDNAWLIVAELKQEQKAMPGRKP